MQNIGPAARVIIIYFVCLIAGQAVAVGVGLLLDPYSKTVALATFIPLYYAMYWVAWRIALYIADPSPQAEPDSADGSGDTRAKIASFLLAPAVLAVDLCD